MAPAEVGTGLRVEVVYCPRPGVTDLVALTLPAGATAADALLASGLAQRHGLPVAGLQCGAGPASLAPRCATATGSRSTGP